MDITLAKPADHDPCLRDMDVLVDGTKVGQVFYGYFRLGGWGFTNSAAATRRFPSRKAAVAHLVQARTPLTP